MPFVPTHRARFLVQGFILIEVVFGHYNTDVGPKQDVLCNNRTMNTLSDNLKELAVQVRELIMKLMIRSDIYERSRSLITPRPYAWKPLDQDGRRIQLDALEKYHHFYSILQVLLHNQPKNTQKLIRDSNLKIISVIEQNEPTRFKLTQDTLLEALQALDSQVELLNQLYASSDTKITYVPDTNALLHNPKLESWTFPDSPKFIIVLTPTVLSELDTLKINYRVEGVRETAEKIIRQIKEYRRRGRLTEGVSLVSGTSDIVAVATEPNMEQSLPWLDSQSKDDRLLATVIEVIRLRPKSPVVLVSRDINLQNKAEFAGIPFIEPPDLPSSN